MRNLPVLGLGDESSPTTIKWKDGTVVASYGGILGNIEETRARVEAWRVQWKEIFGDEI